MDRAAESILRTLTDHSDDELLQLEVIESVLSELRQARQAARVLAHAWDHDTKPPDWALEAARRWDAHGREKRA